MKKGKLTRDEAIKIAGAEAVKAVDSLNCEPTNRVGYNGHCQGDALVEWSASVTFAGPDGVERVLTAYYYTDEADQDLVENVGGDWSAIDWQPAGYEIR